MVIDFPNSYIRWETHEGSIGIFRAESLLNWKGLDWMLGTEVKACHVYQEVNLFKDPSYSFQPLFSKEECIVFRTFDNVTTDDTKKGSKELFKTHSLYIKQFDGNENRTFSDEKYNLPSQCMISTNEYSMQFPIKHLNVNEHANKFQVETGPIVIPLNDELCVGYIAFNTLHTFDFLITTSFQRRSQKVLAKNKCEIKIVRS